MGELVSAAAEQWATYTAFILRIRLDRSLDSKFVRLELLWAGAKPRQPPMIPSEGNARGDGNQDTMTQK
jgi:hypothetical protein